MNRYYRTKEDVTALTKDFPKFEHRSQIGTFVTLKHKGFVEIGLLHSVTKDALWFARGGLDNKAHQLGVTPAVMDFIVNDGPFEDACNQRQLVKIYGRTEKGKLVEVVALNQGSLVDP
jgi:hypothetical protein